MSAIVIMSAKWSYNWRKADRLFTLARTLLGFTFWVGVYSILVSTLVYAPAHASKFNWLRSTSSSCARYCITV